MSYLRDRAIERRWARMKRRHHGYVFWWLLLPGWKWRQ